jgi:hypothetical protein
MDEAAFKQAVLFMFTDVRREITLAKASETDARQRADFQKLLAELEEV